ncbi:uncharacterized protein RBU33_001586 isoform 1-T1 [Hipposideros larvatus]
MATSDPQTCTHRHTQLRALRWFPSFPGALGHFWDRGSFSHIIDGQADGEEWRLRSQAPSILQLGCEATEESGLKTWNKSQVPSARSCLLCLLDSSPPPGSPLLRSAP